MAENKTSRLFMISSLVLGILAAVLAFAFLDQTTGADRGPKAKIIVASTDLRENSTLDPNRDFHEVEVPENMKEMIARALPALGPEQDAVAYKGQRVNREVLAGTPIWTADLVAAADLQPDKDHVAMSIAAKGAAALSGLLIPGDKVKMLVTAPTLRVAIAATRQAPVAAPTWETQEVLPEAVKVLAVGSRLARSRQQILLADQFQPAAEPESQQTVTLDVSEDQAKEILAKTGAGQLPVTFILCQPAGEKSAAGN